MNQLKIIIASTRPNRRGRMVGDWVAHLAREHAEFETEILDLKEINLPFSDEEAHPRSRQYEFEHTKQWSAMIDRGDAFVIVACEYNYGFSGPLKNAIDYLYAEWNYKPVSFVGYGGVSAGARSTAMLLQVFTALKAVPLAETVSIPLIQNHIDNQMFKGNDLFVKSAHSMLHELSRWSKALKQMRATNP